MLTHKTCFVFSGKQLLATSKLFAFADLAVRHCRRRGHALLPEPGRRQAVAGRLHQELRASSG